MIEEARAYLGWERIKDMIRNEEHRRLNTDMLAMSRGKEGDSALSKLSLDEFLHLRRHYKVCLRTVAVHTQQFNCLSLRVCSLRVYVNPASWPPLAWFPTRVHAIF